MNQRLPHKLTKKIVNSLIQVAIQLNPNDFTTKTDRKQHKKYTSCVICKVEVFQIEIELIE